MDKNKIVTINGQRYNEHTGMPVESTKSPALASTAKSATGIHSTPQKSQTLVRRATKKPAPSVSNRLARKPSPGRSMDIGRSNKIARFAPHPVKPIAKVNSTPDIAAVTHPAVKKAHNLRAAKLATAAPQTPKLSKDIKNAAIAVALATPAVKPVKKSFYQRNSHRINIFSVGAVIIAVAIYVTYLNMPVLSVSVAAQQAGIDATYPEYRPDGYRLDGPITYIDGQVTINFAANTGSSTFTLKQSKSSLDSPAVLDNIVRKKVGEKYITNQERGLTIYTYSGNAAWVNAGILYGIEGDAPLSSEQIRRIATSL